LYNRYPEMPEGDLTRMRSALVFTDQLANFARKIGLGNAMRLGRGESHGGGRERAPILCDTFEALIGALYLDQSLPAVIKFMTPLLETASDEVLYTHRIDGISRPALCDPQHIRSGSFQDIRSGCDGQ
jgi:ribonuclease-3